MDFMASIHDLRRLCGHPAALPTERLVAVTYAARAWAKKHGDVAQLGVLDAAPSEDEMEVDVEVEDAVEVQALEPGEELVLMDLAASRAQSEKIAKPLWPPRTGQRRSMLDAYGFTKQDQVLLGKIEENRLTIFQLLWPCPKNATAYNG